MMINLRVRMTRMMPAVEGGTRRVRGDTVGYGNLPYSQYHMQVVKQERWKEWSITTNKAGHRLALGGIVTNGQ